MVARRRLVPLPVVHHTVAKHPPELVHRLCQPLGRVGLVIWAWLGNGRQTRTEGAPISSHNLISLGTISNMLRYFNGKPPHNNRKWLKSRPYLVGERKRNQAERRKPVLLPGMSHSSPLCHTAPRHVTRLPVMSHGSPLCHTAASVLTTLNNTSYILRYFYGWHHL